MARNQWNPQPRVKDIKSINHHQGRLCLHPVLTYFWRNRVLCCERLIRAKWTPTAVAGRYVFPLDEMMTWRQLNAVGHVYPVEPSECTFPELLLSSRGTCVPLENQHAIHDLNQPCEMKLNWTAIWRQNKHERTRVEPVLTFLEHMWDPRWKTVTIRNHLIRSSKDRTSTHNQ